MASENERNLFFGASTRVECASAILSNCSLCLIKPHVFQDGKVGKIIDQIIDDGDNLHEDSNTVVNQSIVNDDETNLEQLS